MKETESEPHYEAERRARGEKKYYVAAWGGAGAQGPSSGSAASVGEGPQASENFEDFALGKRS